MSAFGDRLKEARGALSQAEFGRIGGVQRNAQAKYETGERSPDAGYLQALAAAGIDVAYILTGQPGEQGAAGVQDRQRGFEAAAPTDAEIELLREFRRLAKAERTTVLTLVRSLARAS